jgi:hypothetical protein
VREARPEGESERRRGPAPGEGGLSGFGDSRAPYCPTTPEADMRSGAARPLKVRSGVRPGR